MAILLKHATETASPKDGARVLVDRQLPRHTTEEDLALRSWIPQLAPTPALRDWFSGQPARWLLFRRRYLAELSSVAAANALVKLEEIAADATAVTLLTFERDSEHSHAAILRDLLSGAKKPPAPTGSLRDAALLRKRARRPH